MFFFAIYGNISCIFCKFCYHLILQKDSFGASETSDCLYAQARTLY